MRSLRPRECGVTPASERGRFMFPSRERERERERESRCFDFSLAVKEREKERGEVYCWFNKERERYVRGWRGEARWLMG